MYQGNDMDFKIPVKVYIIYFTFLIAPLIYLFIAYQISTGGNYQSSDGELMAIKIFPFIAFITAIGGILFRRIFMKKIPIIHSEESFEADFITNSATYMIIYLAFFESITIYGFISYILGGQYMHLIMYAIVSIALMTLHYPNRQYFTEMYEQQKVLVREGKFKKRLGSL